NVVHRDLSPDNIVLRGGDLAQATIIDFGIARRTDVGKTSVIGKSFAGKIEYAAPEQFGMFSGVADARSDIYTLGLVLVAACLGHPLDMGMSAVAAIEARKKVPDLTHVPAELRPGLARMLQPDPADRPQSMRDVAALDALDAAGERPRRRGLRVALLVGVVVLAAATAAAFVVADPVAAVRALFDSGAAAREEQAWQQAVQSDTAAAYRAFLAQHPNGKHTADARQRLATAQQREAAAREAQAWQQAMQADTVAAYQTFLAQHPGSRHAEEARTRLAAARQREAAHREEDELWRQAQTATTAEPVHEYLRRYPDGRHAEAARRKLAGMPSSGVDLPARITWSTVACAAIPLWVPTGFACQASNDYALPGALYRYRSYQAGGTVGDWRTQVWMHQVLGEGSIFVTSAAEQALPKLNAVTQNGTDWSAVLTYGGAEFMTFRGDGANCVALRKTGAPRGQGYTHVFAAVQCAPPGQPLFPNDIRATIDGVRLK
ncbi:MAG: protein kinase, partial [Alphaproteobacteria bacterium]|nr:protein kinase [Alphaproteobacteria bacterium]